MRQAVWLLLAAILAGAPSAARPATAEASVGLTEITGKPGEALVTVYYPSTGDATELKRGPFTFQMAWQGPPARGNRRLIVISHGSGGSPWVHANLAQTLVADGFVVAMPAHRGDNYNDPGTPGPESWKLRPTEVSHAIDAVSQDARFQLLLALDKVGMYGMSAGGHTALTLAGGRWSPAGFTRHCEAHIAEDFAACVGLATQLRGNFLDGPKMTLALWVIRRRFNDATWQTHTDPRIAAIVAAVPYAADFDMASLATPRVPLALVTARLDRWLRPRFHSDAVLAACATCERLADFATGGHGALLSPLPPGLTGILGDLLNDPPGFDRVETAGVDRKVSAFFRKLLLS
jgi:predicted dienelactone hydrolase